MLVKDTVIPDVKVIEPTIYGDDRGFFMETFRESWFREKVSNLGFVQDNHSRSVKGILRGLHYQLNNPQGKLVRVLSGEVFDVAVDMRRHSSTFGKWVGIYLSSQNARQLWIPPGFAHGFYVTSEFADFAYKCTDYYAPENERSLLWCDPSLDINWPIHAGYKPSLSQKDSCAPTFEYADYYEN